MMNSAAISNQAAHRQGPSARAPAYQAPSMLMMWPCSQRQRKASKFFWTPCNILLSPSALPRQRAGPIQSAHGRLLVEICNADSHSHIYLGMLFHEQGMSSLQLMPSTARPVFQGGRPTFAAHDSDPSSLCNFCCNCSKPFSSKAPCITVRSGLWSCSSHPALQQFNFPS